METSVAVQIRGLGVLVLEVNVVLDFLDQIRHATWANRDGRRQVANQVHSEANRWAAGSAVLPRLVGFGEHVAKIQLTTREL